MFYTRLFGALAKHEVRYLLVGGLAVNLHGIPRMTMDVDLALALDPANVERFIAAATELALHPVMPESVLCLADPTRRRALIEEKHLIAFAMRSAEPAAPTVDILIGATIDFEVAFARRVTRELDGMPISLAAVPDLIALKEHTGRAQDAADVLQLRKLE